ncbi:hypothetical protein Tco_1181815, partial [Tanacetum coccineum]
HGYTVSSLINTAYWLSESILFNISSFKLQNALVLVADYCCYDLQTLGFAGRIWSTGRAGLVTWRVSDFWGRRGVKEKSSVVPLAKAVKDTVVVSSSDVEEPVDATVNTEDTD